MVRISGVIRESIVDGPGLRFVLFTQGCPHHCPGCHNPQTHDPAGGYDVEDEKVISEFAKNPLLKGMTFSGGEPMEQPEALLPIAKAVVAMGKDLDIYSGYTYEQLLEKAKTRPAILELLKLTTILIDGPFILAERDLTLHFRGSRNQRLIDVQKTLESGTIVLMDV